MDQTKKANTNTSPEMKISCNVKQGTSLVKNSSQTVEIKDKTNEKNHIQNKIYLTINQIDQTKKANTNTSPEMKISCNMKQGTSLVKNSSQTVEIKDKTNEKTAHEKQSTSVNNQKQSTHYELTPVIITKNRNK